MTRRKKRPQIYNWEQLPILLTTAQVAELYDLSLVSVKNMIYNGVLPATKVGTRWRILRDDARALVDPTFRESRRAALAN